MPGKKVDSVVSVNRKKGVFFFEFLIGMFLFSVSLSILWNGFLCILKNCNAAFDLYARVTSASQFLESDKNSTVLKELKKNYSVTEEQRKIYLEPSGLSFDVEIITVSCLQSDGLQAVELWEYCGKN